MDIKDTNYRGRKAVSVSHDGVKCVVPVDMGPRIFYCGLVGHDNLFCEAPVPEKGNNEATGWRLWGGHRLWHAPEHALRTYEPDERAVAVEHDTAQHSLHWSGQVEKSTGLRKSMRLTAIGKGTFEVEHQLENVDCLWPIACAPWALSVMHYGGRFFLPLLPKGKHPDNLLPEYKLTPWSYTDFSDPIWHFGKNHIGIDSSKATTPQKLGISNYPGWSAYLLPQGTFLKYAKPNANAETPDFGSSFEVFCNDIILEMETLGDYRIVEHGQSLTHTEYWKITEPMSLSGEHEPLYEKVAQLADEWLNQLSTTSF